MHMDSKILCINPLPTSDGPAIHRSGIPEFPNRLLGSECPTRILPLILVLMSKLFLIPFVTRPSYALVFSLRFSMTQY